MERRQFLGLIAASAASAQRREATQAAGSPPSPKAKITSSVMLWTLAGSFEARVEAAARAGLQSVELVGEYAAWSDADTRRALKLVRSFQMGIDALIATPDWTKRPVSMVDPEQRENFLADVRNAIGFARKLETPQIILMSGNALPDRTHEEQYRSLLEGTKRAGDLVAGAGLTAIVEPLNSKVDHKGFFLTTCTEGLKLVREVDNPHVKLLFDIYHEQVQQGNVLPTIAEAAPQVAVFHVADSPGRHDPGTGQIDYKAAYKAIQKSGFAGYVAMEYLPKGETVPSLIRAVDGFRSATI